MSFTDMFVEINEKSNKHTHIYRGTCDDTVRGNVHLDDLKET